MAFWRRHSHLSDRVLLLALEGELSARARTGAALHLARCESCRAKLGERQRETDLVRRHRERVAPHAAAERVRARLRARLREAHQTRVGAPAAPSVWFGRALPAAIAIVVMAGAIWVARDRVSRVNVNNDELAADAFALPVPAFTPGAVKAIGVREICAGIDVKPLAIAAPVREAILRDYKMTRVPASEYELDHLITPELGGASDRRNLWPERYQAGVWNARVKDQLEDLLPRLVCAGGADLATAQHDIASNWIEAYKKYFHTNHPLRAARSASGADDDFAGDQRDDARVPVAALFAPPAAIHLTLAGF